MKPPKPPNDALVEVHLDGVRVAQVLLAWLPNGVISVRNRTGAGLKPTTRRQLVVLNMPVHLMIGDKLFALAKPRP